MEGRQLPELSNLVAFFSTNCYRTFINSINKGKTLFATAINNKYKQATNWWQKKLKCSLFCKQTLISHKTSFKNKSSSFTPYITTISFLFFSIN